MKTKGIGRHGSKFRRGKFIATLVALTAMVGAVQVVSPTSAMAMRAQCENLFTISQRYYQNGDFTMGDYYVGRWARCEEVAEAEEQAP
jgi:hypothetical protein